MSGIIYFCRSHLLFICKRLVFGLLLFVTSCVVGPNYQRPHVETPAAWKGQSLAGNAICYENLAYWWEIFSDPILNELESKAVSQNQDLTIAMWRLYVARVNIRATQSSFIPKISFDPFFSTSEQLVQYFNPSGVEKTLIHPEINQFDLPFNVNYEFDLWGKSQREFQAAVNCAQASEANLKSILLSISADVAHHYFVIRTLDTEIELLMQAFQLCQDHYHLQQKRFQMGHIHQLEVCQARLEASNTEAELCDLMCQRVLIENQIAVLIGEQTSSFSLQKKPFDGEEPPNIPAGIPGELLLRRPDIAKVERELAAQNEKIGIAQAEFYPSLTISGIVGFSTPLLDKLGDWQSRFWLAGAQATQAIFDGGYRKANVRMQVGLYQVALANYYQQILIALREVEDAICSLNIVAMQKQALQQSVEESKIASDLAQNRYQKGFINYLGVMDTERTQLQASRALVQIQGKEFSLTVQLIKALGGDF